MRGDILLNIIGFYKIYQFIYNNNNKYIYSRYARGIIDIWYNKIYKL
jgi:hypothetical protein